MKLFSLLLLVISLNCLADDCIEGREQEIMDYRMKMLKTELADIGNMSEEQVEESLYENYYRTETDTCGEPVVLDFLQGYGPQILEIGEILSSKEFSSEAKFVNDFLYHEYGCANGGSC